MYIQALIINAALILLIPRVIQKPIGVSFIDEFVTYLRAQQSFLVSSSLLLALVLYLAHLWIEQGGDQGGGPDTPSLSYDKA